MPMAYFSLICIAYICILKYINTTCSVSIMLLVSESLRLTGGYWITSCFHSPWRRLSLGFSTLLLPVVFCIGLRTPRLPLLLQSCQLYYKYCFFAFSPIIEMNDSDDIRKRRKELELFGCYNNRTLVTNQCILKKQCGGTDTLWRHGVTRISLCDSQAIHFLVTWHRVKWSTLQK